VERGKPAQRSQFKVTLAYSGTYMQKAARISPSGSPFSKHHCAFRFGFITGALPSLLPLLPPVTTAICCHALYNSSISSFDRKVECR
jgi:hypothetical protein